MREKRVVYDNSTEIRVHFTLAFEAFDLSAAMHIGKSYHKRWRRNGSGREDLGNQQPHAYQIQVWAAMH